MALLQPEDSAVKRTKKHHPREQGRFCEFCGGPLPVIKTPVIGVAKRRKYCSEHCARTASRRRVSARLGIPSRGVSKLDPLYFN